MLSSPAAFLASSNSTEVLCNTLWDSNSTTPDPDVGPFPDADLIRTALQHRLHIAFLAQDTQCPLVWRSSRTLLRPRSGLPMSWRQEPQA